MASSSDSASTAGQIRISGSIGSGWLYCNAAPSSRDAWNPAASATAAGAAESHSYCPPAWIYASASPSMTAAASAPAEPSGTNVTLIASPSRSRKAGGLVRLTTTRSGLPASRAGGIAGGAVVASTWPWAGSATAPAVSAPRSQSATWTAQSVRPGSPNSLVPSSGSTIHTRPAASRAMSSRPSSDRTASPGLRAASSAARNSCESRSPALRRSPGSPPWARRSSSSAPACSASSAARRSSSVIQGGSIYRPAGPHQGRPSRRASRMRACPSLSVLYLTLSVKCVLRRREPPVQKHLHGVRGALQDQGQLRPLRGGKISEHIDGRVHSARGPADPDPRPVVVAAQAGGHRPEAVVPVVPAAELEPDRAERQIQLVVDHHHLLRAEVVEPADPGHRPTGFVHERERLDDGHALAGQPAFRGQRAELAGLEPCPGPCGQHVRGQEARVVPV